MSLSSAAALFLAMAVLAALPSLSVLLVATKAASSGFSHGVAVAAGIVVGDLVFVALVVSGLVVLAEAAGDHFVWFKYGAALYVTWLGVRLWQQSPARLEHTRVNQDSLYASGAAGLLLTLADHKAILFYLAFFPAFIDLDAISGPDVALIAGITVVAVGGVKTVYAYLAAHGRRITSGRWPIRLNRAAAVMLVIVGVAVLARG
ncbi:MAG: LysE family translocator [Gammaproteobacteria bacterium]|nr:LysE family translocator [Gammaproteobacteria bacterium]